MANKEATKYSYVDHPEIGEIFADSVQGIALQGSTVRINFTATRLTGSKSETQGSRHLTARLVLTPEGASQLSRQLSSLAAAIAGANQPQTKNGKSSKKSS
jgi:hypothetical protein